MKKKIYSIFAAVPMALAVVSCNFLDVDPEVITDGNFYNSEQEVIYGLAGVYGVINSEEFYGNNYSLMLSNTDDLCYYNRTTANNYSVWYRHDASSPEIYSAWTMIYRGVNNANAFMEAVQDSEFDQDHKYYNEARFLRAYYHFILAQAWGDIPVRKTAVTELGTDETNCPATPQLQALQWVASEMEACLDLADTELTNAPSRITRYTILGILSRVYLFMAGETVSGNDSYKHEYFGKARDYADMVITEAGEEGSNILYLNPSYSQFFINMIEDVYDPHESLWEADFMGNRSSSDNWSNGRIGDLIGLQSTADVGTYDEVNCNYAYGQYNGSMKLWNLYWTEDRTDDEDELQDDEAAGWDARQAWNMPPYNYAGGSFTAGGVTTTWRGGIDKTPYRVSPNTTFDVPTIARGVRNCGKYRRETIYEGVKGDRGTFTPINYPILRYSDVLLMYAEASNEYEGPTQRAYDMVKKVRDRAGIKTRDYSEYSSQEAFRQFVRNERGRELCFESLRKYDLIRWGIFVDAMKGYIPDTQDTDWGTGNTAGVASSTASAVQARHIVLPIPSIELGVNTDLVQNPLW